MRLSTLCGLHRDTEQCYLNLITIIHVHRLKFAILIDVIFCRLKINHDSREFILEFGTVANTKSRKVYADFGNVKMPFCSQKS
jgi:hypothetical protein